ncbi:MAG: hypothetical protein PHY43_04540 [Verrucomicrobiales bacterium]|nr:hypothetical protein [Verrucomicrobiales bacterium]
MKPTTGGSMMNCVPQLVGESEFSEFLKNSRFFGKLVVLEPWQASVSLEAALKIKNQIGVNHD